MSEEQDFLLVEWKSADSKTLRKVTQFHFVAWPDKGEWVNKIEIVFRNSE